MAPTPYTTPYKIQTSHGSNNSNTYQQKETDTTNPDAPPRVHRHPHDGNAVTQPRKRLRRRESEITLIYLHPRHSPRHPECQFPTPISYNHGHYYALQHNQRKRPSQPRNRRHGRKPHRPPSGAMRQKSFQVSPHLQCQQTPSRH